ncbi:MAG: hypothetical protein CMM08_11930 [Rhodospirillaceae bacterium]|jgi:hypothetical protein|nr:hypothetical protein [Rhodospirillaceae bacterium]MDP6624383.1 hypothetical protein [Alphaproteobacteria bacterium]|tara:strand:- start:42 stop:230 length:189 start_codon:yes stop_codon:yes gene_type:complete
MKEHRTRGLIDELLRQRDDYANRAVELAAENAELLGRGAELEAALAQAANKAEVKGKGKKGG